MLGILFVFLHGVGFYLLHSSGFALLPALGVVLVSALVAPVSVGLILGGLSDGLWRSLKVPSVVLASVAVYAVFLSL